MLSIIGDYNFSKIVDLGCGKGNLTHFLKKKNNYVLGVDASKTAVGLAGEYFPDIEFICLDVSNTSRLMDILQHKLGGMASLVFTSELFSYLENWRSLLYEISKSAEYFMINLYAPKNPIGFVKTEQELLKEIDKEFYIIEHVTLHTAQSVIIMGSAAGQGHLIQWVRTPFRKGRPATG